MRNTTTPTESWRGKRSRCPVQACDRMLDVERQPPVGAHIVTPRRGYTHHGIYVGSGLVVQYGGLSRRLRRGPVEEVPMSKFSDGRPVWVRVGEFGWQDRPEVAHRARSRLGEDRYHLLTNNCEHFCEWCVRGEHRSYQVDELFRRHGRAWQKVIAPLARVMLKLDAPVSDQLLTMPLSAEESSL